MAAAAMKDELGLDADALALFEAYTSLLDGGEGRKWMVSYRVISQLDPIWDQIKEKLGGYDVVMDAATGAVEEITWDLAAEWVEADYTVRDWATAPVYHSKLVPWLAALKAETDAIVAKYPDLTAIYDYTPEDAAAHDTAFREAGFPAEHFSYALPAKDDVQAEEAIRLARQALLEEGVATAEALDGAGLVVTYSIAGENGPCWYLSFFVQGEIEIDYGVTLDARDGNILRTAISTGGNG